VELAQSNVSHVVADAEMGYRANLQLRHLISHGIQQACGSEDSQRGS